MKKQLAIIFTALSIILILDSFNIGHALTMFLLAGIVPGTDVVLSAGVMLEFFALAGGFVLARVCQQAIRAYVQNRSAQTPTAQYQSSWHL